jgi:molybdenum cofactor biosynthesis protein B
VESPVPARIDESIPFQPLKLAVLTVSDTRTEETDKSGRTLKELASEGGHEVVTKVIVPDTQSKIEAQLRAWIEDPGVDVVITTGGTGVTPRDVTPEAVEAVSEKLIPGFGELFRQLSYEGIATSTIQSRAIAGTSKATYIFALPGSTGACRAGWEKILRFQLDIRHRPCNFAELLPRLREEKAD